MTTMDQIHRIRELYYEQDKNLNEIAIIMGCDWRTVRKYVDMMSIPIALEYSICLSDQYHGLIFQKNHCLDTFQNIGGILRD